MDDGLIQFLVIAVFVIISIMDGAARKRRKQAQQQGRLPELNELPSADEYLDEYLDEYQDEPGESSEQVVPKDVWSEIASLARGEVPAPREEAPPAPEPEPMRDLQAGYLDPDQAATHEKHAVVGPTVRPLPVERPHEPVLHPPEPTSDPVVARPHAGRAQGLLSGVRHGTKRSLLDAIILAEVLDSPVAMRGSHRRPGRAE